MFRRLILRARVICPAQVGLEEWNSRAIVGVEVLAYTLTVAATRRREAGNADKSRLREKFCHFGNAPHIFFAVGTRHAEVGAQAWPDVVAVEHEHLNVALEQLALQRLGQRRLSAAGDAGEPDDCASMAVPQMPLAASHVREVRVEI